MEKYQYGLGLEADLHGGQLQRPKKAFLQSSINNTRFFRMVWLQLSIWLFFNKRESAFFPFAWDEFLAGRLFSFAPYCFAS
ncbi:hypothetical protein, partial [Paenibacillus sp. S150]|uniref:hypothetical protein n=1 Tax=Paenibacillus sp. S150 TaxID=2749826 RepID=UPI001C55A158